MGLDRLTWIVDTNGCWLCTSHLSKRYPKINIGNKTISVHRYVYTVVKGEIPKDLVVRHTCDVKRCMNPDHLILGTQNDNVQDKVERNRQAKGSKNGRAKLTEADIIAIRNDPRTQLTIAKDYNVASQLISRIKLNECWRHI